MTPGTRVRIHYPGRPYHGTSGTIRSRRKVGTMIAHQVELDKPVLLDGATKPVTVVTLISSRLKPFKRKVGKPSSSQAQLRRADLYDAIIEHKKRHDGNSPSIRELSRLCGIPSVSTVKHHLMMLERDGLIEMSNYGRSRMITVTGGQWVAPGETQP